MAANRTVVDLMFLLSQASHALETELAARLAELGVTPRHHCVLSKALGEELTQGQLAELSALDKTTMTVTVDELEKAGLAVRKPSPADRRARIIEVTAAGKRKVDAAQRIVDQVFYDVLATLPAADRDGFLRALTRLAGERLATPVHTERPVRRRAVRSPQLISK